MDEKLKEQVELIRQVFKYIDRFKNKTFVIKIDCSIISHPFFSILVKDLALLHSLGIQILLVPGAKQRIDEVLKRYDISWKTVKGIRISTPEAIPFIKMAAFDVSNRLMTQLAQNNIHAVIGNWVRARSIGVREGVDFQSTGIIEKINIDIVKKLLQDGMIPIFPNIGWNISGKPYNISSNELACSLSCELKSEKLFFISNHSGINNDTFQIPSECSVSDEGIVTHLTVTEAEKFINLNNQSEGNEIIDLVSMAYQACNEGVARVHIVNGEIEGVILKEIFSNRGSGTMVYANQHENIREMNEEDIPEVKRIMQPYIEKDILLPRNRQYLEEHKSDFAVYEVDGIIHACGALHIYSKSQGEIAAVAVDETYSNLGIGKRIIYYLIDRAKSSGLKTLFVLTTQSSDWFLQFGFKEAKLTCLPDEKKVLYSKHRNSRILKLEVAGIEPAS